MSIENYEQIVETLINHLKNKQAAVIILKQPPIFFAILSDMPEVTFYPEKIVHYMNLTNPVVQMLEIRHAKDLCQMKKILKDLY